MDEVENVDTNTRTVMTHRRTLGYDYLVLATGSDPSYFGYEEWCQFAPGLKTVEDATATRSKILEAFERAALSGRLAMLAVAPTDPIRRRYHNGLFRKVSFAICQCLHTAFSGMCSPGQADLGRFPPFRLSCPAPSSPPRCRRDLHECPRGTGRAPPTSPPSC